MNQPEMSKYILRSLKRRRSENEIITSVCEVYGIKWSDAQNLVHIVRNENQQVLQTSQNMIVVILGVLFIFFGFLILFGVLWFSFHGVVFYFPGFPIPYLGNLALFGIGLAVIWGSAKGLLAVFKSS